MEESIRGVLARLYAPGRGEAAVRSWPGVVRVVRRAGPGTSPCEALDRAGLAFEAMLLGGKNPAPPEGLLTAIDPEVEGLWPLVGRIAHGRPANPVEISLDAPLLPPAVWASGDLPPRRATTMAGIGCRLPSGATREFARSVGARASREGVALVSGGAEGCDAAFATGHEAATAILPHGIDHPRSLPGVAGTVSAFAREAEFSREHAMRRNALIVAAADLTLVASCRLKTGGSWHAATGALRRRAPVAVYVGPGAGDGARGLVALGALPIRDLDEALAALDLVRRLGPQDDPSAQWARACGRGDERRQPALL